ncbi:MAG: tetraacyldisaccharide 4'-kinase, partial [Bauldia litoralis]
MRTPDFWSGRGPTSALLLPAGAVYAWATRRRVARAPEYEPPVPVVCIGNLSAGGSGKTPVAMSVAAILRNKGLAAHLLTRGYGGRLSGPVRVDPALHSARDVGDEPLLLARAAPTWVARDRAAGARAAVAAGAEAVVMDDGHQNPALRKDLSLVVIDGGFGFGNRRVVPAGPLREPIAAGLARADAVVMIGEDETEAGARLGDTPRLNARLAPTEEALALRGRK